MAAVANDSRGDTGARGNGSHAVVLRAAEQTRGRIREGI
jgi:hypothetical protein